MDDIFMISTGEDVLTYETNGFYQTGIHELCLQKIISMDITKD
jgi:hypothetical protein